MFTLLVVEDDRELNRAVCPSLDQNGYDSPGDEIGASIKQGKDTTFPVKIKNAV